MWKARYGSKKKQKATSQWLDSLYWLARKIAEVLMIAVAMKALMQEQPIGVSRYVEDLG